MVESSGKDAIAGEVTVSEVRADASADGDEGVGEPSCVESNTDEPGAIPDDPEAVDQVGELCRSYRAVALDAARSVGVACCFTPVT